ncbi:MAG: amidohydrolase family protein [Pseudomonadota bacterium]|nr:MAG: amidohydrolase family protein [Pseudomonadota bacterium]
MHVDTLIHAAWVIPVEPHDTVLADHVVAVKDGRIHGLCPGSDVARQYTADVEVRLTHHALIPGLVNAHGHAAMTLMRGLADDLHLMDWLKHHIWPAESRWVGAEFVHDGSRLACAEMLRSGTTCFNDMYFFAEETAQAATQAGMRAVIGMIVVDFPSAWAQDADEYITKGLDLHDQFRNSSHVFTAFAPHAPYTVSDGPLQRIATLAEELDVPVHMHVHESSAEVEESVAQFGKRPLQRLA